MENVKKTKNVVFTVVYGSGIIIAAWIIFLFVCKHTESREYPVKNYSAVEKMNVPVELMSILNGAECVDGTSSDLPCIFLFLTPYEQIQYDWCDSSQKIMRNIYNLTKSYYLGWKYLTGRRGGIILFSNDYTKRLLVIVTVRGGMKEGEEENYKVKFCPEGKDGGYIKLPDNLMYRQIIWTGQISKTKDWVVRTFLVLVVFTISLLTFFLYLLLFPWIKKRNFKF